MRTRPWLPYVVPFAVYMAFVLVQSRLPVQALFWTYPLRTLAVAVALWVFRRHYEELRPARSAPGLATGVGLLAIAVWIAIDPFYPKLTKTEPFNPLELEAAWKIWWFIGWRVTGAVLVVPVMEELFWRAFLIRWLVEEDFKRVPVGTFTWPSFAVTVALFGVEHNEWLAGLICGALYNWLLYRTKSVFACVMAHAVSNAALAAWVLARGDWKFW